MRLPALAEPKRYAGLYIFDFGDHVSVGYTTGEVVYLLESEKYKRGKVYKIHRATADGTLEIRGVPRPNFAAAETMLFVRSAAAAARADFEALREQAEHHPPPCPAELRLTTVEGRSGTQATMLSYAAANSEELGAWLSEIAFEGGDRVECDAGGPLDGATRTLAAQRLEPPPERTSRSRDEVLTTTHLAVQR